jgi:hypothetical protein
MCYIYLSQSDTFVTNQLMKKITLAISSLFLSVCASAQVSLAPFAAFNVSGYGMDAGFASVSNRLGVKTGVMADVGLSDHFYLQPGVYYAMNGFRISIFLASTTANINTLEVPLNVTYKIGDANHNRFFVSAGPYIGFNLSGNATTSSPTFGGSSPDEDSEPIIFGSRSSGEISRFDWGVNLNAGYELKNGIFAKAYYQLGIQNLAPIDPRGIGTMRSYSFGVGIGYLFKTSAENSKKIDGKK